MVMSSTLTKIELVNHLSLLFDIKLKDATEIVNNLFEEMIEALAAGDELSLSSFGNFILRDKKERIGRNPKTNKEFPIVARRVVSFHTSAKLRNLLRDEE